jgi:6,7-dimethyl-8-ribityllumazine synthase
MHDNHAANLDASSLRIGVVVSRYHPEITDALLSGAIDAFTHAGGDEGHLRVIDAPGTWELTAIARAMALLETRTGKPGVDAIVALGCVLTGETTHDQYIAQSVTQGLTAVTIQTGVPVAFGVLTCKTIEQALARSLFPVPDQGSNKGVEAMRAAIAAANTVRHLQQIDRSMS